MTEEQWNAIQNRDKRYDGVFFCALKTSKVVCRPSCPSRHGGIKNIIIYDTLEEALANGCRPCLRCRPDQPDWPGAQAELAERAKKFIEERYTEKFSTAALARELYINGDYLSRVFKKINGCTLLQYHNYVRCTRAKELLRSPELRVSYISDVVGYKHTSHFSQVFQKIFHCTPLEYRRRYLEQLEQGKGADDET